MKTEEPKKLTLEFDGDEVDKIKSAIKKIDTENGKIGFKNHADLDADEIKIFKELAEKLK